MITDSPSNLSLELESLRNQVHAFARDVLRPASMALDSLSPQEVIAPNSLLWETLRAAYAGGLHTALIPASCGGMGLQGLSLHVALEELGWGSADFAISLGVTGFPFFPIAASGNQALIEETVSPFVADRSAQFVGCWGITEPAHGSDHFMPGTPEFHDQRISGELLATRAADEFVISGRKAAWVSNGTIATHALVHLSLDPAQGLAGGGVAFIPLGLPWRNQRRAARQTRPTRIEPRRHAFRSCPDPEPLSPRGYIRL